MHKTNQLFEALNNVLPYPDGVIAVPEQIPCTSFFPGGTGLWCDKPGVIPPFPVGGVMVLGHDFHSEAGYESLRQNKLNNLKSPTWENLLKFLQTIRIDIERCFFTNIYMGLREGKGATGNFPGASDPDFVKRCQGFFLTQLAMQKPSLILTLGAYVPPFLARLSPQLKVWATFGGFRKADANNVALISGVEFSVAGMGPCVLAAIVHPSFRKLNIRHRKWDSFSGEEAEVELVREAVRLAINCDAHDSHP
jgi:hypothetical protein